MAFNIYNPFNGNSSLNPVVGEIGAYMDRHINDTPEKEAVNCAIYGLHGSGKSVFLNEYFCHERCAAFAKEKQLFPMLKAEESIEPGTFLYSICKSIVEYVNEYLPDIKLTMPEHSDPKMSERLENMLKILSHKHRVSLVIDEFQRLAQSDRIKDTDYSKFRNLSENKLVGFIVATDFDFEKTNSKNSAQFNTSFFTDIFAGKSLQITGMSRSELDGFLDGFFPEGECAPFSANERDLLYSVSGGILGLAQKTAQHMYELKQMMEPGEEIQDTDELREPIRHVFRYNYFEKWCSDFNDAQKALLAKMVIENKIRPYYTGNEYKPHQTIEQRCFIVPQKPGRTMKICCSLFEDYIRETFVQTGCITTEEKVIVPQIDNQALEEAAALSEDMRLLYQRVERLRNSCEVSDVPQAVEDTLKFCNNTLAMLDDAQAELSRNIGNKTKMGMLRAFYDKCCQELGEMKL